jgi:formylglycine-generating enzyme required for sulfatase activity
MGTAPDAAIDLTEAHVADALGRLASGRALGACPLVHAHCINLHIQESGVAPSSSARAWALAAVISEIVQDRLAALRDAGTRSFSLGRAATPSGVAPKPAWNAARSPDLLAAERECLERDFLTDNSQREAWSCLYYRFIHVPPLQVQEITTIVRPGSPHGGRKLVFRRTHLGIQLLTAALLDREKAALRRMPVAGLGSTVSATPRPETNGHDAGAPHVVPATEAVPAPAESLIRWRAVHTALDQLRADVLAGTLPLDLPRDEARLLAGHAPADLAEYRLTRIAAWCRPRYALDKRFVALSMLVDRGEEAPGGRWAQQERRYDDLSDVLGEVPDPALVLLGAPGSGKSTVLRRLELDLAVGATRAGVSGRDQPDAKTGATAGPITFFVDLGRYVGGPGADAPEPLAWLNAVWRTRYPKLPALDALLAGGGVILLLDALNEMPHADAADYRRRIRAWRAAVIRLAQTYPGNRVIFSCRSLDYSAPLSSLELRVPQVQVEPLDDARIRAFLDAYSPDQSGSLWEGLAGTVQVDLFRAPYFLKLLVEEVGAGSGVPQGRGALFTRMLRGALKREVERVNPLFDPGPLIAERDYWRVVQAREWSTPYELPERGALFGALANLAFGMQRTGLSGEGAQVRLRYDDAGALLGEPHASDILHAAEALGALDDDAGADEVRFVHQLMQEYFAARRLAAAPEPALLRVPWQAIEIEPGLREIIDTLPIGETLPQLAQTGWEETAVLAAAMAADVEEFVRGLMAENLVVAGRCANLPELQARLSVVLLDELRWALVARSRDFEADLRARIAAGLELGRLGDPRFERRVGPDGDYLSPPMVEIAGGRYPIGDDEPIWDPDTKAWNRAHMPRHEVDIAAFAIGWAPVTNAEWRCFIEAGGYEDERWWDTADARSWRRGELDLAGAKNGGRHWRKRFRENPDLFLQRVQEGRFADDKTIERWRSWISLDDAAFEVALNAFWHAKRLPEPEFWRDARFNAASQPVVGVCWYEARAYCNWLGAQSGQPFRLPTEVEWEAAARGISGRPYAYGDAYDAAKGNVSQTRVKRTTPVGVFIEGDTRDGASDMGVNVVVWTTNGWGGADEYVPEYGYPYDPKDGREDIHKGTDCGRVLRSAAWDSDPNLARAAYRDLALPHFRSVAVGLRCCCGSPALERAR